VADDFKYHIHHHASLVVPADLAQARADHAAGTIGDDALSDAVESAIADTLLRQRRLALAALSDGEFRRRNHLSPVYDAVDGFGEPGAATVIGELVGPAHAAEVRALTGTPVARGRLVPEEGAQLGGLTHRPTMIALPSPGFLAALGGQEAAGAAMAEILRSEIAALAAEGVDYVLLRNPALAFLLVADGRAAAQRLGIDPDKTISVMLEAEAAAVAGLDVAENFRVGLDLTSAGQARGPWDRAAVQAFLAAQPFGRLCVDFPADPDRRFPLDLVSPGLVMSLGVVDISDPEPEDVDELVARVDEAAKTIDIDDIAISTNGGFHVVGAAAAPYEHGKLQRVEMAARYFWGNEL
jgi:5-methyltetrahydropteroyltriglutamate--homocysteine methyltransferase